MGRWDEKRTMEERFRRSRESMEKMRPGHGQESEKPVYNAWGQTKWNEGLWVGGLSANTYASLTSPDERVFFAGDHTTHVVGWQEGRR